MVKRLIVTSAGAVALALAFGLANAERSPLRASGVCYAQSYVEFWEYPDTFVTSNGGVWRYPVVNNGPECQDYSVAAAIADGADLCNQYGGASAGFVKVWWTYSYPPTSYWGNSSGPHQYDCGDIV